MNTSFGSGHSRRNRLAYLAAIAPNAHVSCIARKHAGADARYAGKTPRIDGQAAYVDVIEIPLILKDLLLLRSVTVAQNVARESTGARDSQRKFPIF